MNNGGEDLPGGLVVEGEQDSEGGLTQAGMCGAGRHQVFLPRVFRGLQLSGVSPPAAACLVQNSFASG